jgi:osmotically-inducible protein OsmY
VNEDTIEVFVEDGEVTLVGNVDSYMEKRYAETDVRSVPGVSAVENRLVVVRQISEIDDGYLERAVREALANHADIDAYDITIEVKDGVVTLSGTVDSIWEKAKAETLVSALVGVRGIENKMAVVPSDSILDETIAENIVYAIDRKAVVDVEDVDVKVVGGVVTLSGSVPSRIARDAVYRSALYTFGVIEIRDELKVEGG